MNNIIRGLTKDDILKYTGFNLCIIRKLLDIDMFEDIPNEIMKKIENCRIILIQTTVDVKFIKLKFKDIDFETTEFTQVSSIYDIGNNIIGGDFIITTNKSHYDLLDIDDINISDDDVIRLNRVMSTSVYYSMISPSYGDINAITTQIYFTSNLLIKTTDNKYIVIKGCDDISNLYYKTLHQLSELPSSIVDIRDNLCYILESDKSLMELSALSTIKPEYLYTTPIITSERKKFK